MKIALFTEVFLPKIDGITNRLSHTLKELKKQGHEVLVFAPSQSVASFEGYRIVPIPGLPFPRYPGLQFSLPLPRIVRELKDFAPELVHLVGPACLGIWGLIASRMLEIPLVASYHTDFPAYMPHYGLRFIKSQAWNMIRTVHNQALRNLCPSHHTLQELKAQGIRNLGLWRGGVDTKKFHPSHRNAAMRQRLSGGHSRAPLALYVGRLGFEKNLDRLQVLLRAFPRLRIAFVGDGPARPMLEEQYRQDPVVFTGFLKGQELSQAYASADIFLMPSTTETLGFVTLEAMSSELPVLAARAGGTTDIVRCGINGVLYDPAAPESMIAGMRRLLENRSWRLQLGEAARQRAEQQSWYQETQTLLEVYHETIVDAARLAHFGDDINGEFWARFREPSDIFRNRPSGAAG